MNYRSVLKKYPSSSKFKSIVLILILTLTLVIKGITVSVNYFENKKREASITILLNQEPNVYSPLFSENSESTQILNKIFFRGLVKYNPETKTYENDLAEFVISEDAKSFSFRILEDQYWSDGKKITIEDALFTYKNIIQNSNFTNKFLYNQLQSVVISQSRENEMTVEIPSSNSFFIDLFKLPILPKHIYKDIDIKELANTQLDNLVVSTQIKNVKQNDSVFSFNTLDKQRFEIEIAENSNKDYNLVIDKNLEFKQGYNTYTYLLPQYTALFMNMEREFFKNKIHRQAINDAVNKHDLESKLTNQTIISKPFFQFEDIKTIPKTSFSLINDSLNQSPLFNNLADNKSVKLSLVAIKHKNEKLNKQTRLLIDHLSQNLERINIELVPQLYDIEIFKQILINREYDLAIFGHDLGANYDSYSFWHSSQRFQNGLNINSYYNPLTDNLLENLRRESNQQKKLDLAREINKQLTLDIPAIFLFTSKKHYFVDNQIKNRKILNNYSHTSDIFYDFQNWQKT